MLQAACRPLAKVRFACCRRLGLWLLAGLVASGCAEEKKVAPSVSEPPLLHMIHPQLRTTVRIVGQPSFVESYERTSIYPKLTAFIEKWNVDIGDKVKKGDVLADLFVPELREQWETKKATVVYDEEQVSFA
jgi:multidrug efflux pump subunit AcrA (membrane-fusion protein)